MFTCLSRKLFHYTVWPVSYGVPIGRMLDVRGTLIRQEQPTCRVEASDLELDSYSHMDNHCEPEGRGTCNVPAWRGLKSNMVRVWRLLLVVKSRCNSNSSLLVTNVHMPGRLLVGSNFYYCVLILSYKSISTTTATIPSTTE